MRHITFKGENVKRSIKNFYNYIIKINHNKHTGNMIKTNITTNLYFCNLSVYLIISHTCGYVQVKIDIWVIILI